MNINFVWVNIPPDEKNVTLQSFAEGESSFTTRFPFKNKRNTSL